MLKGLRGVAPFWEKCGSVLQPYVRKIERREAATSHVKREGNKLLEN
jgi:hypothetical protein